MNGILLKYFRVYLERKACLNMYIDLDINNISHQNLRMHFSVEKRKKTFNKKIAASDYFNINNGRIFF